MQKVVNFEPGLFVERPRLPYTPEYFAWEGCSPGAIAFQIQTPKTPDYTSKALNDRVEQAHLESIAPVVCAPGLPARGVKILAAGGQRG